MIIIGNGLKTEKVTSTIWIGCLIVYIQLVLVDNIKIGYKKEKLIKLKVKESVDYVQHLHLKLVDKVIWLSKDNTLIKLLIYLSNIF